MDMLNEATSADLHQAKKRKTPWTTRMHNVTQSPLTTNNLGKAKETSQLGQSLKILLSRKCGRKAFRDFLESEFCEESLDFWLACEEFKTISSPEMLSGRAASIYEAFIGTGSPKEVNLDFHTRDSLAQNLQRPSPCCFTAAQNKIYSLMENDAFPRFVRSDRYKDLCHFASKPAVLGKHRNAFRSKNKVGLIGSMHSSHIITSFTGVINDTNEGSVPFSVAQ